MTVTRTFVVPRARARDSRRDRLLATRLGGVIQEVLIY